MQYWPELDARVAMALYRVIGDRRQLRVARKAAFSSGVAGAHGVAVPALFQGEPGLTRRWKAGRIVAMAERLEADSWNWPCECDDGAGYQCSRHFETSDVRSFYAEAARAVQS